MTSMLTGSGGRKQSTSAFGETRVTELRPIEGVAAYYDVISDRLETVATLSGSTSIDEGEFVLATGTTANTFVSLRTKRALVYRVGFGACGRFTARYTAGIADSRQLAGLFNDTDGYRVGYNGTAFGILHERGGVYEIRTLTLSAGASGTESLTIVVDDDSHTFDVTTGTAAFNAYEIAAELNTNITGWSFHQIDGTVVAIAQSHTGRNPPGPKSGTYSLTNNSAGTCLGTWAQTHAGVAITDTWIPQSDWNGQNVAWLDPTKGNIFEIQIQYLGFGNINFNVEDPSTGLFTCLHQIKWANQYEQTSVGRPSFKVGYCLSSMGSTTDIELRGGSVGIYVEGDDKPIGRARGLFNTNAAISTTPTNVLSIKNRHIYGHHDNVGEVVPKSVFVSTDGTKGGVICCVLDPTLTGTTNYNYADESNSMVVYDTSAVTYTVGSGNILAVIVIGPDEGVEIDLSELESYLLQGEKLSIIAEVISGSASSFTASINWLEVK